ncbi:Zinc finger protein Noc [Armadillidium vulgare]|nr:Zinc finger protein Noc [Armadillidium vulgare]
MSAKFICCLDVLDSKKSPLALLAQTCSQIGADSSKPLPTSEKKKEDLEPKKDKTTPSPPDVRRSPAFKPYESASKKEDTEDSKSSSGGGRPASTSHMTQRPSSVSSNGGSSVKEADAGRRSIDTAASSSASTTPIIRSGLEVLAGHPKDVPLGTYRPGVSPFLPHGYPAFETHPALRGAPPGLFAPSFLPTLSLASSYSGAAAALYSTAGLASSVPPSLLTSPYLSYTRVKTAGGGEAVVPVCRDPFCTGCPYSVQNNHLLQSGGACPPSCTQCEQAKAALSALPGLASVPPSSLVPASSLLPSSPSLFPPVSTSASSPLLGGAPRPYVCNWIAGDAYCGKRFSSSEELLTHLRSHTTVTSDASALSLLSSPLHAHAALLGSAAHSSLQGFHRQAPTYPPPSLSPLTAGRYHPYGKPTHSSMTTASILTPSLPGLSHYPQLSAAAAAAGYPPGYPYASLYPRPPL